MTSNIIDLEKAKKERQLRSEETTILFEIQTKYREMAYYGPEPKKPVEEMTVPKFAAYLSSDIRNGHWFYDRWNGFLSTHPEISIADIIKK